MTNIWEDALKKTWEDELKQWKQERSSYPGWLVAPNRNRNMLIESFGNSSIEQCFFFPTKQNWRLEQQLEVWAEYNWRVERALWPLFSGYADRIESLLGQIAPFSQLDTASPFFAKTAGNFKTRADLRWAWSSLAIGMLRYHREHRNEQSFREWIDRLAPLDGDLDEIHHQRAYQQALWHLTFLADDQAPAILKNWQAERGTDPYWQVRKAGLLIELGQEEEATHLTEECLRRLQGKKGGTAPFFATTRESAIRNMAWAYGQQQKDETKIRELSGYDGWHYRHELSELSRKKCDNNESYRVAAQALRLSEELAEPLAYRQGGVRSTSPMSVVLGDVFDDLVSSDADLAYTMFMRIRDDSWKDRFTPAQIAAFPKALIDDLKKARDNAWWQVEHADTDKYVGDALSGLWRVLRLLRWRMPAKEHRQTFVRLLNLGEKVARQDPALRYSFGNIINEYAQQIGGVQALAVLPDVLHFPLPSEVNASSSHSYWPTEFLSRYPTGGNSQTLADHSARIDALVRAAPKDAEALWRLSYLYTCGLLPKKAAEALAACLWTDGDRLSKISPLYLPMLLELPAPQDGMAAQALAKHFVVTPPPPLSEAPFMFPEGIVILTDSAVTTDSVSIIHSNNLLNNYWFSNLVKINKPYRTPAGKQCISWTDEQVVALFTHAEQWWCSAKKADEEGFFLSRSAISSWAEVESMYHLRRALARAIAPNLPPGSREGKERLRSLLQDIEASGFPMLSVLPFLMRFKAASAEDVSKRLISGIRSGDPETAKDALWGIIHWCEFQKEAKLPAVPHRLIEQLLIYLAAHADGENAVHAVGTLEAILDQTPEVFSKRAKELLGLVLDSLQARAAYPAHWYQHDPRRDEHIVDLRKSAVLLAAATLKAGFSDAETNAEAINYWREVAKTDPLTVVREAATFPDEATETS